MQHCVVLLCFIKYGYAQMTHTHGCMHAHMHTHTHPFMHTQTFSACILSLLIKRSKENTRIV